MQHDKGKVSIIKHVIIDTQTSDVVLDTVISKIVDIGKSSSPIITDSTRLESIINPGIMSSSSNPENQFIILEDTVDLEFLSYNNREHTSVKQKKEEKEK